MLALQWVAGDDSYRESAASLDRYFLPFAVQVSPDRRGRTEQGRAWQSRIARYAIPYTAV